MENKIGRVRDGGRGALSLSAFFSPKKHAPFEWQRLEKKIGKILPENSHSNFSLVD